MKRSIIIIAILITTAVFAGAPSAQGSHVRANTQVNEPPGPIPLRRQPPTRRYSRTHKKYTYGYRNYGRYRRTQVGNRRLRYMQKYYPSNGTRLPYYHRRRS